LRRFNDAVSAYQKLIARAEPDADLLVDYAVALGMSKGQTLSGEPEAVLAQALKQAPGHPQALALSGSAAFERRDYALAVSHWQNLLTHMPADEDMRAGIQANIDKARALQVGR
jgi:cytochrome c-type biogenesis protein CcmH